MAYVCATDESQTLQLLEIIQVDKIQPPAGRKVQFLHAKSLDTLTQEEQHNILLTTCLLGKATMFGQQGAEIMIMTS